MDLGASRITLNASLQVREPLFRESDTATEAGPSRPGQRHAADPRTLIFIHIPKTGGTTLQAVLERECPAGTVFDFGGDSSRLATDRFRRLPKSTRAGFRVVAGHVGFGVHRYLPQPFTYVTVLRHPVDRIMSHYFYVLRRSEHYLHEQVTAGRMSLVDYALSDLSPVELDNGQVRMLSATGGVISEERMTEHHLMAAKEHLWSYFSVVGGLEQMGAILYLLQRQFRLRSALTGRLKVTRGRRPMCSLSAGDFKRIKDRNFLDYQLYSYARNLLQTQLDSFDRSERARYLWFRARQGCWDRLVSLKKTLLGTGHEE
jgi:hypothetical protein